MRSSIRERIVLQALLRMSLHRPDECHEAVLELCEMRMRRNRHPPAMCWSPIKAEWHGSLRLTSCRQAVEARG